MIFGVDGTGAFWNSTYKEEMKNSFVSELCGASTLSSSAGNVATGVGHYWRGPDSIDTFMSGPNPRAVAEVIRRAVVPAAAPPKVIPVGLGMPVVIYPKANAPLTNLKDQVFLTGYSRGAATVLDVAVLLNDYGITVEAMFLFDSVTRSPWLSATVVPANVKNCYHAMRNPVGGSRVSFGNSAPTPAKGVNYVPEAKFLTTHGGMGGTPWGAGGLIAAGPVGVQELTRMAAMSRSAVTPGQMAEAMVHDQPQKYGDKIYEGAPDWRFTTVTVAQEEAGKKQVREWMWQHLKMHKLVP